MCVIVHFCVHHFFIASWWSYDWCWWWLLCWPEYLREVLEVLMFLLLPAEDFHSTIFRFTIRVSLLYSALSPLWQTWRWRTSSLPRSAADLGRLDSFLRRCRRLGYCEQSQSSIAELFSDIDDKFFSRIISNSKHILQQFLHDRTTTYSLRLRNHSKVLVNKTAHLSNSDFLIRLLYKYSY